MLGLAVFSDHHQSSSGSGTGLLALLACWGHGRESNPTGAVRVKEAQTSPPNHASRSVPAAKAALCVFLGVPQRRPAEGPVASRPPMRVWLAHGVLCFSGAPSRALMTNGATVWRATSHWPRPSSTTCSTGRPCPRPAPQTCSPGRSRTGHRLR